MRQLIDADTFKRRMYMDKGFQIDKYGNIQTNVNALNIALERSTIDAVPLDGSFLKMSRGDYLIYNRHWFYEHFDMEVEIQRSAMKSMGYEPALKDAEPVRHGKWIEKSTGGEHFACCSECGYVEWDTLHNYCPHCGARMDKKRKEE